jgi:hypothetical protein
MRVQAGKAAVLLPCGLAMAGSGLVIHVEAGAVGCVTACSGEAGRLVWVRRCESDSGTARQAWFGSERRVQARSRKARRGRRVVARQREVMRGRRAWERLVRMRCVAGALEAWQGRLVWVRQGLA